MNKKEQKLLAEFHYALSKILDSSIGTSAIGSYLRLFKQYYSELRKINIREAQKLMGEFNAGNYPEGIDENRFKFDNLNKNNKELTIITGGCFHYPHHDPKFISCFLQVMDYVKPDECILLGDIKDNAHHSSHNASVETLCMEARKGKKGFKSFLQEFIKRCKKSRYIRGNHEAWIDIKKELSVALYEDQDFTVPKVLGFDDLDIEYYKDFYIYNDFVFEHGNYFGEANNSAKKQFLDELKSGISVHTHRFGQYRHTTRTKNYLWTILGCGCLLEMWYDLRGKSRVRSGWNQSFAIVKFAGKIHHVTTVHVNNGKCMYDGKLFTAD